MKHAVTTKGTHLDHYLTEAQLAFILLEEYKNDCPFEIRTVELPEGLGTVPSGIYGPIVGDPIILDSEVHYKRRGNRKGDSRIINQPNRPTRQVTIIAGNGNEGEFVLYTVYGGPAAPREPWDKSMNEEERREAEAFWAIHALSNEA